MDLHRSKSKTEYENEVIIIDCDEESSDQMSMEIMVHEISSDEDEISNSSIQPETAKSSLSSLPPSTKRPLNAAEIKAKKAMQKTLNPELSKVDNQKKATDLKRVHSSVSLTETNEKAQKLKTEPVVVDITSTDEDELPPDSLWKTSESKPTIAFSTVDKLKPISIQSIIVPDDPSVYIPPVYSQQTEVKKPLSMAELKRAKASKSPTKLEHVLSNPASLSFDQKLSTNFANLNQFPNISALPIDNSKSMKGINLENQHSINSPLIQSQVPKITNSVLNSSSSTSSNKVVNKLGTILTKLDLKNKKEATKAVLQAASIQSSDKTIFVPKINQHKSTGNQNKLVVSPSGQMFGANKSKTAGPCISCSTMDSSKWYSGSMGPRTLCVVCYRKQRKEKPQMKAQNSSLDPYINNYTIYEQESPFQNSSSSLDVSNITTSTNENNIDIDTTPKNVNLDFQDEEIFKFIQQVPKMLPFYSKRTIHVKKLPLPSQFVTDGSFHCSYGTCEQFFELESFNNEHEYLEKIKEHFEFHCKVIKASNNLDDIPNPKISNIVNPDFIEKLESNAFILNQVSVVKLPRWP